MECNEANACAEGQACQRTQSCMTINCASNEECSDVTTTCNTLYGQCETQTCTLPDTCRSNACDSTTGLCSSCSETVDCTAGYHCHTEVGICYLTNCDPTNNSSDCPINDTCNADTTECTTQSCTVATNCRSKVCGTNSECDLCKLDPTDIENTRGDCPEDVEDDSDMEYQCNADTGACDAIEKPDSGLSGGAIAAIVICSVIGVIAIALITCWCIKK